MPKMSDMHQEERDEKREQNRRNQQAHRARQKAMIERGEKPTAAAFRFHKPEDLTEEQQNARLQHIQREKDKGKERRRLRAEARNVALASGFPPSSAPDENIHQQAISQTEKRPRSSKISQSAKLVRDLSERLALQLQLGSTNTELKARNVSLRANLAQLLKVDHASLEAKLAELLKDDNVSLEVKLAQLGVHPDTDAQAFAQFLRETPEVHFNPAGYSNEALENVQIDQVYGGYKNTAGSGNVNHGLLGQTFPVTSRPLPLQRQRSPSSGAFVERFPCGNTSKQSGAASFDGRRGSGLSVQSSDGHGLSSQPLGGYGSSGSSQNRGFAPRSAQGTQQRGRPENLANQESQYGGYGRGNN